MAGYGENLRSCFDVIDLTVSESEDESLKEECTRFESETMLNDCDSSEEDEEDMASEY